MATDPLTGALVRERAVRERSRWLALAVIGAGFAVDAFALANGYDPAFWLMAVIAANGAIIAALLFRPGPLFQPASPLQ